jgi:hypothetical protein
VLRLSLLSGLGALTLFSGAAMADGPKFGGYNYGYQYGYGYAPKSFGTNSNIGTVNNSAIGVGNVANQSVTGIQAGGGFGGFNSNLGQANNSAIGVGNVANQSILAIQGR